jgi:hypothetical protein
LVSRKDKAHWGNQFSDRKDCFDDSLEFDKLKEYIKSKYKAEDGYTLVHHPRGVKGPDAILFKDGEPVIHFAFERRGQRNWLNGNFRFSTLHVPADKDYLMDWADQDKCKFVSLHFCHDLSRAFYARPEVILESPVVETLCKSYNGYVSANHRDLPVAKLTTIEFND